MIKADEMIRFFFEKKSFRLLKEKNKVLDHWKNIAGEEIALHSELQEIEKETLVVEVDHPAVHQLISLNKKKILEKLNKKYPVLAIKKIKTMAGKIKKEESRDFSVTKTRDEEFAGFLQKLNKL